MKRILSIVLIFSLFLLLVACDDSNSGTIVGNTTGETARTTSTTRKTTTAKTEPDFLVLEPGQYKIGTDAPAKLYLLFSGGDSGYFEVTSDGNTIIINDNFQGTSYARVEDGEYLTLSRTIALDRDEKMPIIDSVVGISDGMFYVGPDIPAGEYKLRSTRVGGTGYYEVTDSRHNIIQNDNFEGTSYVTVKKGTFLKLSRAEIISAP